MKRDITKKEAVDFIESMTKEGCMTLRFRGQGNRGDSCQDLSRSGRLIRPCFACQAHLFLHGGYVPVSGRNGETSCEKQ